MTRIQKITLIVGAILVVGIVGVLLFSTNFFRSSSTFWEDTENSFSTSLFGSRYGARERELFVVKENDLYLPPDFFTQSGNDLQTARKELIQQLINQGFSGWVRFPYATGGNHTLTASGQNLSYIVQALYITDPLDDVLSGVDIHTTERLLISHEIWSTWTGIYLFKNKQDLTDLGYTVVSHRTRKNQDEAYRRTNISQAFKLLGNVRVLLPGEELHFLDDAQFDENQRKNYLDGYAIIENEEEKVYGGGICGASTALYQGIITNKSLKPTMVRNHTKWFTNLYTATINGEVIKTPGIDSAIYEGVIDLYVTNTSDHPIIIVMNYDGSAGGIEEIFSLGRSEDQGSIEYLGGYTTSTQVPDKSPPPVETPPTDTDVSSSPDWIVGTESSGSISEKILANNTPSPDTNNSPAETPPPRMKTIHGGCHTRLINGEERKSCYREIK